MDYARTDMGMMSTTAVHAASHTARRVFGEGESMGPWSDAQKEEVLTRQTEIRYDIDWTTLGEYLESLERRGVSPNVASFVGA
jgi:N-acyl-D-amino-acid deacylase